MILALCARSGTVGNGKAPTIRGKCGGAWDGAQQDKPGITSSLR